MEEAMVQGAWLWYINEEIGGREKLEQDFFV
jgi:hypothetical protein